MKRRTSLQSEIMQSVSETSQPLQDPRSKGEQEGETLSQGPFSFEYSSAGKLPQETLSSPKKKRRARRILPAAHCIGIGAQPLQTIEWVPREQLHANSYNPNSVAPIELHLLKISILEDGWTQPLVVRESGEIVDGYHRWLVSAEPAIAQMTNGLLPVVRLSSQVGKEHQILSTIRHNRAHGDHTILKMADIVRLLLEEEGMSREDLQQRLQMEPEEVDRLADRSGMIVRGAATHFHKGWVPQ